MKKIRKIIFATIGLLGDLLAIIYTSLLLLDRYAGAIKLNITTQQHSVKELLLQDKTFISLLILLLFLFVVLISAIVSYIVSRLFPGPATWAQERRNYDTNKQT